MLYLRSSAQAAQRLQQAMCSAHVHALEAQLGEALRRATKVYKPPGARGAPTDADVRGAPFNSNASSHWEIKIDAPAPETSDDSARWDGDADEIAPAAD